MSENPDKIADKLGVHAPNSQVNIENMFVGSKSDPTKQQDSPIDWQKICRDMLVEREQLTSNRLMMSPDMHKTLDIFVDLALIQQKKADKRNEDVLPEYGSQLYEPSRYSESERFEFNRFLKEVLGVQKNEKLTIIGEPGSGKTTLLQKVAFWLLDNTEDLVLWVSLGELKDKPLRDYLTDDWLQDAVMYADSRILEDWERQFLQRRIWLLLDGLDEMTPETRDAISLKGWVSQARVIVTCRLNVWQTNPRIIDGFEIYRMLEFRLSQMEEFIQKWFSQDEAAGYRLHQALNQPGKERIRDLGRNPLRLTLLCSTWHLREGKLPDTRAELYKQFVDDLYEWKREHFPTSAQQREELNNKLGELAKEAIDKELTRFRLRYDLVCKVLGDPDNPDSMLKIALNLGWLNAIGVDLQNPREPVYAFFHATLQEYFAAKNVEDWSFFLPPEHKNKPVEEPGNSETIKPYRLFESQWKEVILLWLGRNDIEYTEKCSFIEVLLNFNDECGDFYYYQAFFLAALGILEIRHFSTSAEVIQRIIQWGFGELDTESKKWFTYFKPIEKQARITLLSTSSHVVINDLLNLLKVVERQLTSYEIADLLSKIDYDNTEAINTLKVLLDSVEDDWLRLQISNSLIQISPDNLKAERSLIELTKSSQYEWLRCNAAWSLMKFKPGHLAGIDSLINLLCTTQDETILWNLKLDEIGMTIPKLLRTLFRMSYLGKTPETRGQSMIYLARLMISDEKAIERILEIIQIPKLILNLIGPSATIQNHGIDCLKYIAKLADEAHSGESRGKRKQAFWKLVEFTINQPEIAILTAKFLVGKEGGETRKKNVSELFKKIGVDIALTIPIWIDLVGDLKDRRLRTLFAAKMTDTGFEDERISVILTNILRSKDTQGEHLRRWLAEGLKRYDRVHLNFAISINTQSYLSSLELSFEWSTSSE